MPGRQFRIVGAFGAAAHLALHPHHPFRAQLLGKLERRRIRIDHALRQPVMVAQIDEQHAAMVADAVTPAREANDLADVALAERAAGMGPVTMHGCLKRMSGGTNRTAKSRGPKRRQGLAEAFPHGNRMQGEVWASKKASSRPILGS